MHRNEVNISCEQKSPNRDESFLYYFYKIDLKKAQHHVSVAVYARLSDNELPSTEKDSGELPSEIHKFVNTNEVLLEDLFLIYKWFLHFGTHKKKSVQAHKEHNICLDGFKLQAPTREIAVSGSAASTTFKPWRLS